MKKPFIPLVASLLLGASTVHAAQLDIQITNLTRGSWFTPLLVTAHPAGTALFTAGQVASISLQTMAEGGDIAPLAADLAGLNATTVENPAGGLLAPGATVTTSLDTDDAPDNTLLSIVAMILPSNDGFMGLNAIEIPQSPGTYVYNVNAYDAGTEANDEVIGSGAPGEPGFPAPPPVAEASGTGGTGVATVSEGFVHIHRNVLGDTDPEGGVSDIDSTVHRWLNPVVRIVLTVSN
ncbi:MAG: spondin domain-containing protein [Pseudomonadota bacterium]